MSGGEVIEVKKEERKTKRIKRTYNEQKSKVRKTNKQG